MSLKKKKTTGGGKGKKYYITPLKCFSVWGGRGKGKNKQLVKTWLK